MAVVSSLPFILTSLLYIYGNSVQTGVKPMKCECCEDQAAQPCQREATHSLTVTVKTGYDGSGDGGDYCETHAGELAAILRDQGFEVTVRELGKHRRAGAA